MHKQSYLMLLEPWAKASEKYLFRLIDRPELEYYGTGTNNWGVQTNQKAFAAFAVLAAEPDFDEKRAKMTRKELLNHALGMLRFSLQSHLEGDYECLDGTSWGHTWISALGIERMMHGVEAICDYLISQDWELLKRVLVSECDWLMDKYPIVAGLVENNKPESNLWNGALLHRVAAMYPDMPRASEYREKGTRFLINSISISSDKVSSELVDGKKISDCFIGGNFFETFSLNHHGYLNVGYMVICLSNVAMLHFMRQKNGLKTQESIYHHVLDLWKLVKTCIFPDGRLMRIGGDTRVRYCYCQDYLIPSLLMIMDKYNDTDCEILELGWLEQVKREQEYSGDGSFLSKRLKKLEKVSPLYYTRLESDRAVTLSMGLFWRRIFGMKQTGWEGNKGQICGFKSWHDDYHGACLHKSRKRIASWVWKSAQNPQGLCLPPQRSDMAEWRTNLAGQINGLGHFNTCNLEFHKEHVFEGGFLTYGRIKVRSQIYVAEGEIDRDIAVVKIVYAALPDDATVLVMQYAYSLHRDYFTSVKGLMLQIPNDLYNGNVRIYNTKKGLERIAGNGSPQEVLTLDGIWLNVDDCLSISKVYGNGPISILRPGTRQIDIKHCPGRDISHDTGSLYADEICCPCYNKLHLVDKGEVLIDAGFLLRCGTDAEQTRIYNEEGKCRYITVEGQPDIRIILCEGANGKRYLLAANIGKNSEMVEVKINLDLSEIRTINDIAKKGSAQYNNIETGLRIQLAKDAARLFIVE